MSELKALKLIDFYHSPLFPNLTMPQRRKVYHLHRTEANPWLTNVWDASQPRLRGAMPSFRFLQYKRSDGVEILVQKDGHDGRSLFRNDRALSEDRSYVWESYSVWDSEEGDLGVFTLQRTKSGTESTLRNARHKVTHSAELRIAYGEREIEVSFRCEFWILCANTDVLCGSFTQSHSSMITMNLATRNRLRYRVLI
jgi:hypothetical protein